MSDGTAIITEALQESQIVSVVVPASPEQINHGLGKLNSMVQMWISMGIKMNLVPLPTAGDQLHEPADARNGIVLNLAILLATAYKRPVSDDLRTAGAKELAMIKLLYQEICIPDAVPSSTLPKGAGNSKGVDSKRFFGKDSTISG
ncbi:MAG: hypothetical protein ACR2P5_05695 [Gammaproteobacteria bacterium]